MTNEMVPASAAVSAEVLEQVIAVGDLDKLSSPQRVEFYRGVCQSLGLNPLTRPFEYIRLNNKLTLYARKDATDQLRSLRGVSIEITGREKLDDVYVVTAVARTKDGRTDSATGAVAIAGLKGEAMANAFMKAETKAKRRATLSIVGLGWLDEAEVESIDGSAAIDVDQETGEIHEPAPPAPAPQPGRPQPPKARNVRGEIEQALRVEGDLPAHVLSRYLREEQGVAVEITAHVIDAEARTFGSIANLVAAAATWWDEQQQGDTEPAQDAEQAALIQ